MYKFVKLMSTGIKCVLTKLAAYIFHALKIRDDIYLIDGEWSYLVSDMHNTARIMHF